jgi:hypothetical protein
VTVVVAAGAIVLWPRAKLITQERIARAWFRGWTKVEQSSLDNLVWRAKRLWHRWFTE